MNAITRLQNALIIFALISYVVITQYYLLYDSLTLGFKPDDWILYFAYKLLGANPLSQLPAVWSERGLYTTYQVYYMGLLDSLFGLNYYAFHTANLFLKIIATLGLYPLVVTIFKKKFLAFLTVILFSISHSAVGPLEFVVKGGDYLSIIFMEAFLLTYYLIISGKLSKGRYHSLLLIFFISSFVSSPIRMFPLLLVPMLIEAFMMLKGFNISVVKYSLIRLLILYFPFLLAFLLLNSHSLTGDAYGPAGIFKMILEGNWYLILAPFSGVGYSFITHDYWGKLFGSIMTDDFKDYAIFLLGGPTLIPGLITALISWSLLFRKKILFFCLIIILNSIFQIMIFFVSNNHLRINPNINYDTYNLYSVIFGGFILIVGLMTFFFWLRKEGKNSVLAAFWVGSAISFIFTFLTWAFAPLGTGFSSTSYYLVVASIGSSLMTAAFFTAIYDKSFVIRHTKIRVLAPFVFIVLIMIFIMSSREIRSTYSLLNQDGRGAGGQIMMQQEARMVITKYKKGDTALFYFDTSDITGFGPFYTEGFLISFPYFMLLQQNNIVDGCIGVIYEDSSMPVLKKSIQVQDGVKGFNYPAFCVKDGKPNKTALFFTQESFYAFKIKDKKLIEFKADILKRLSF